MFSSVESNIMTPSEYKTYHESFMRNNHGSSVFHTFTCIFMTMSCTIITSVLNSFGSKLSFSQEYALIVFPMVLGHTILSDFIYEINITVFLAFIVLIIKKFRNVQILNIFRQKNCFKSPQINSISIMRGLTYLITIFSILAVDFRAFPRFLAKTEKYGHSLMDTGVGLFVLMSGLVHKSYSREKLPLLLRDNVKLVTILIILGFVRFVSVKQLDYQEHVTEYGVHWNFFFTLASVKVMGALIAYQIDPRNYLLSSFLVLFFHEILLASGLETWVFSSISRDSLLSANREGLSSLLGYFAMFLFAIHTKRLLTNSNVTRLYLIYNFSLSTFVLWVLAIIINIYRPASRTVANAGYCIYLEAVFLSFTTILYVVETLVNEKASMIIPRIVKVMNENGLIIFLTGNLLTGAINLSTRTIFVQNHIAILILNIYMISVISFGMFLNKLGVKL